MVAQDVDRRLIVTDELDVRNGMILAVKEAMAGPMVRPVEEVELVGVEGGRMIFRRTGQMVWQIFGSAYKSEDDAAGVDGGETAKEKKNRLRMEFWDHVNAMTLETMIEASVVRGFDVGRRWWEKFVQEMDYGKLAVISGFALFVVGLTYRVFVLAFGGGGGE